jgi:hypothetical protein
MSRAPGALIAMCQKTSFKLIEKINRKANYSKKRTITFKVAGTPKRAYPD